MRRPAHHWFIFLMLASTPGLVDAQCLAPRDGMPFDFKAAPHSLFETDFSSDAVGRFPKSLEFKTGALQVAEWQGRRVLKASSRSAFAIPLDQQLPAQFTLEVGVVHRNTKQVGAYTVEIYGGKAFDPVGRASTHVMFGPDGWWVTGGGANSEALLRDDYDGCVGQESTLRIAVDGNELMLYGDERPLGHVPNAAFMRSRGIVIQIEARDDNENAVYITNIKLSGSQPRVAVAQPVRAPQAAQPERMQQPSQPELVKAPPAETQPAETAAPARPQPQPEVASATIVKPPPRATDKAITGQTPAVQAPAVTAAPGSAQIAGDRQPTAMAGSSRIAGVEPAPNAPANMQATYLSGGNVALTWDPVPGATQYDVFYTTPGNNTRYGLNYDPIRNSYHVSRELAEGTYQFTVSATTDAGVSPQSKSVTVAVPRWYNRYRVTINGFKVNNETMDNQAEIDGKRDEVFVRAITQVFHNPDDKEVPPTEVRTFTHGDVNAARWQDRSKPGFRMNAGRASGAGGLMTGDAYPNNLQPWLRNPNVGEGYQSFPLIVFDGDLYEDINSVVIIPTIWEDDESEAAAVVYNKFLDGLKQMTKPYKKGLTKVVSKQDSMMADMTTQVGGLMFKDPDGVVAYADSLLSATGVTDAVRHMVATVKTSLQLAGNTLSNIVQTVHLMNNSQNRPIGLAKSGANYGFKPKALTLTYDDAEAVIAGTSPGSFMPGILRVDYNDNLGVYGQGSYTLFIEVRRVP